MLDEDIMNRIIEREKNERRDSGWQPVPLYNELDLPRLPPGTSEDEDPAGKPVKIDIWGPSDDNTIINDNILNFYSPRKYF